MQNRYIHTFEKKDCMMFKESDQKIMTICILESLYGRPLIELSRIEHQQIKENFIHLSEYSKDKNSLHYKTIHVGSNIH